MYSKSSRTIIFQFCNLKQNNIQQNQFHYRLIDANKGQVPAASHWCPNKMKLTEDLLYLYTLSGQIISKQRDLTAFECGHGYIRGLWQVWNHSISGRWRICVEEGPDKG